MVLGAGAGYPRPGGPAEHAEYRTGAALLYIRGSKAVLIDAGPAPLLYTLRLRPEAVLITSWRPLHFAALPLVEADVVAAPEEPPWPDILGEKRFKRLPLFEEVRIGGFKVEALDLGSGYGYLLDETVAILYPARDAGVLGEMWNYLSYRASPRVAVVDGSGCWEGEGPGILDVVSVTSPVATILFRVPGSCGSARYLNARLASLGYPNVRVARDGMAYVIDARSFVEKLSKSLPEMEATSLP